MAAREACTCDGAREEASEKRLWMGVMTWMQVFPKASDPVSLFLSVLRCDVMEHLREGQRGRSLGHWGVAVRGIKDL